MGKKEVNRNIYLSHWDALRYWQVPFIDAHFDLDDLRGGNIHMTVFDYKARRRKKGYRIHCCTLDVPAKYLRHDERAGIHVVAPAFAYLQVVSDLDKHERILLGKLLCAYPDGLYSEPLVTVKELLVCAEEMKWHRGRKKALNALKYAKDGSNSPREALIHMLLSLPHALGGANLQDLVMNYEIRVAPGLLAPGESGIYYADYALPEEKILIEFDSRTYHSSREAREADERRARILQLNGYDVYSLTTEQVEDPIELQRVVDEISHGRLRRRRRIRARRFWEMRLRLQALLTDRPPSDEVAGDVDRYVAYCEEREARLELERHSVMSLFLGPIRWGFAKWKWNRDMLRRVAAEIRQCLAVGRQLGERIYRRSYPVRSVPIGAPG
ncbi:MAG: DUF559 domain-containing protein [Clostridiaceae bacterium]|nr:DUF559 domain-containing protein [Clostridiaceae bacterium]